MSKYDNGPVVGGAAITPSSDPLVKPIRGFHVGTGGDVEATLLDGTTIIFKACAEGGYYPYACTHILDDNTTADDIVGLY